MFIFFELFLERNKLPIQSLEVCNPIFLNWKSELIMIERIILRELGFSLYIIVDHPHQFMAYIMTNLQTTYSSLSTQDVDTLAESAWFYLNESKKTSVELEYEPIVIACAAVYLAANIHDIVIPSSPTSWWLLFDVDYSAMREIGDTILDMYDLEIKSDQWVHPMYRVEYQHNTYTSFR